MHERGYINNRLGFPETGYSSLLSMCYWNKSESSPGKYLINFICRTANIHETYFAVVDDFGSLVVTP